MKKVINQVNICRLGSINYTWGDTHIELLDDNFDFVGIISDDEIDQLIIDLGDFVADIIKHRGA